MKRYRHRKLNQVMDGKRRKKPPQKQLKSNGKRRKKKPPQKQLKSNAKRRKKKPPQKQLKSNGKRRKKLPPQKQLKSNAKRRKKKNYFQNLGLLTMEIVQKANSLRL